MSEKNPLRRVAGGRGKIRHEWNLKDQGERKKVKFSRQTRGKAAKKQRSKQKKKHPHR